MKTLTWRDDPPTKAQLESIAKMSRQLNRPINEMIRTKGEATDLILKLKQYIKDDDEKMKKFFGWK